MNWLQRLGVKGADVAEESALMTKVRASMRDVEAYANSHGGSLQLVSVSDEGEVVIKLRGTCITCPLASMTMKQGVEKALLEAIPEVKSVRAVV